MLIVPRFLVHNSSDSSFERKIIKHLNNETRMRREKSFFFSKASNNYLEMWSEQLNSSLQMEEQKNSINWKLELLHLKNDENFFVMFLLFRRVQTAEALLLFLKRSSTPPSSSKTQHNSIQMLKLEKYLLILQSLCLMSCGSLRPIQIKVKWKYVWRKLKSLNWELICSSPRVIFILLLSRRPFFTLHPI